MRVLLPPDSPESLGTSCPEDNSNPKDAVFPTRGSEGGTNDSLSADESIGYQPLSNYISGHSARNLQYLRVLPSFLRTLPWAILIVFIITQVKTLQGVMEYQYNSTIQTQLYNSSTILLQKYATAVQCWCNYATIFLPQSNDDSNRPFEREVQPDQPDPKQSQAFQRTQLHTSNQLRKELVLLSPQQVQGPPTFLPNRQRGPVIGVKATTAFMTTQIHPVFGG